MPRHLLLLYLTLIAFLTAPLGCDPCGDLCVTRTQRTVECGLLPESEYSGKVASCKEQLAVMGTLNSCNQAKSFFERD